MNLRDLARGQSCLIRVPGFCSHDPEQVVLCHVRMVEIPSKNFPGRDLLAAFGCSPCHMVVDGQTRTRYTHDECRLMLLEGVMRTQAWFLEQGLVTITKRAA